MFQIGLLGAGDMARTYARVVQSSGFARLASVYAPDDSARACAEATGARQCAAPGDIINDDGIAAVIIASPSDTHFDYLRDVLSAGKHVFSTSPAVLTAAHADELERLCAGSGKSAAVDLKLRSATPFQYLAEQIEAEAIGRIGVVRLSSCSAFYPGANQWRDDRARTGGVLLDQLTPLFDFLERAFGPIERIMSFSSEPALSANDYVLITAKLSSGAIAHIEGSWTEPDGANYLTYEVSGASGLIDYDSRIERTLVLADKSGGASLSDDLASAHAAQLTGFLARVQQNETDCTSLISGLRAVRLALAAEESAKARRPAMV